MSWTADSRSTPGPPYISWILHYLHYGSKSAFLIRVIICRVQYKEKWFYFACILKPRVHLNKIKRGHMGCMLMANEHEAWICPLHSFCPPIRTSSCVCHGNLLNERRVPSMVICPYWSLWCELLPNITASQLTSFSKQSSEKLNQMRTLGEATSFPCV